MLESREGHVMMRFSGKGAAWVLSLLLLAGSLAGCELPVPGGGAPAATAALATAVGRAPTALQASFAAVAEQSDKDVAILYGGEYRPLADCNPDVGPEDNLKLLGRACSVYGFYCP